MSRVDRLTAAMRERELDLLLVTDLLNLRWLTGFTGSNGLALVGAAGDGARRFVTDFRYLQQSAEQLDEVWEREIAADLPVQVAERLPAGAARMGFDDAKMRSSSCPREAPSRACARSRSPRSSRRSARRPASPTRR